MEEPRREEGCRPAEAGLHDEVAAKPARRRRRRYSEADKLYLVEEYQRRRQGVREFCLEQELTEGNFRRWLKESGVAPRSAAKRALKKASRRRRHFTPEEKRAAVEAFEGSDLNQTDFCATWGLSVPSLRLWLKRHRELGPQGLEPSPRKRALPGDPRSIPEELRAEIIATKERHPEFGSRKIRDELYRFRGLKVAATTVTKVLVEAGLAIVPRVPLRRRRSAKPPRRFERARPGELWQSDITSLVLRREGRRVYLTVFMDDHSRYVVSWSLRLSQRQELVTECLLDGIARFGKPLEVLTDQGRQYFAWRGKSGFQKLLDREGIRHVVSRTHHPETLGKCERFWKTVQEEFWERAKPQDLHDARERLGHFIAHYNHFRPHQGIGGVVPADRFFEATSALKKTLESKLDDDELDQALHEPKRRSVFLFGRVGDEEVALHGERGEIVLHRRGELRERIGMDELGQGVRERSDDERGASGEVVTGDDERDRGCRGEHDRAEREAAAESPLAQADALFCAAASGEEREGALAGGERRGQEEGASDRDAGARDLARQEGPEGGGGGARDPGLALLAALPAGGLGYAGGSLDPAENEEDRGDADLGPRGGPEGPPEADRGARARPEERGRPDRGLEAHPGSASCSAGEGREPEAEEEGSAAEVGIEGDSGRGKKEGCATTPRRGRWWRGFFRR